MSYVLTAWAWAGFTVRDLSCVEQLLQLCLRSVKENGQGKFFAEPLCHLLDLLSIPFVKKTSMDDFLLLKCMGSLLNSMAAFLDPALDPAVQQAAAKVLAPPAATASPVLLAITPLPLLRTEKTSTVAVRVNTIEALSMTSVMCCSTGG